MTINIQPPTDQWAALLERPQIEKKSLESLVQEVFEKVKADGDAALVLYTQLFDKKELKTIKVSQETIKKAADALPQDLKNAIATAKANIERFHQSQAETPKKVETMQGVTCWRESRAIEKVGIYIPAGTAPLFSTVLMLGVPAKLAGCQEIILCSAPDIHPAILYAADLVGITDIFAVGGIQAIAALTHGTESVPKVYKIFGPGNQYVTAAKQQAQSMGIAIDMPAGPSEVLVIADATANPAFVAADLLSQAEHGTDSQVVLLTTSEALIPLVMAELEAQLAKLPRQAIAEEALKNSRCVVLQDLETCIDFSNQYAPEHLILAVNDPDSLLSHIINAGSVFLGHYTPESAGDYASGTNHTLPTNGYARAYSGVSLDSFLKKITFQRISPEGLKNIGSTIENMATAEQLIAHKNAVSIRLKTI